ncbi:MAG TPA: type IV pilus modification protein PilV [Stenotrophobium sp.]|nr:type IV pilus modification protein PilV [Stenotrophobium sp.]
MNRLTASNNFLKRSPLWVSQRGVGLIEVLVAVLVLSVGLLGIALVQINSLSSNNSSMTRSQAVVASYTAFELLRAQRADALGLNQTLNASACNASGTAYVVAQLNLWCQNDLAGQLGTSSTAFIQCDANGVCTITITFHTLDCGQTGDGRQDDGLCTQSVSDGRAQQIITKTML